jgi:taurine dioxygenase
MSATANTPDTTPDTSATPDTRHAQDAQAPDYATIRVTPISARIGAEVTGLDLRRPLSADQLDELRAALRRHLVLFLRDQDLSDDEHIAAARQLGEPNVYPVTRARGLDQPLEVIEDSETSPPKTDLWHTDAAFLATPPDLAMINMRLTPPTGGDTLWCSLYSAYEKLSPTLRAFVDGLEQDLHPGDYFRETIELQFGKGIYEKVAEEFSGARHPLVRVHPETGRHALFLCGAYVRGLVGLEPTESELLYGYLRSLLEDPNLQCRWRWRVHDVAIWDERCTNHRALSDHAPARRRIRRCTIGASRPIGPRPEGGPGSGGVDSNA